MGVISVAAFAIALVFLIFLRSRLGRVARDFDRDEPVGVATTVATLGLTVILILAAIGIVDSYVYKLPNPFSGPKVGNELPQSSPPPPTPSKPDIKADDLRPDLDELKKEHRDQIKEFEHGPPPAERTDR